MAIILANRVQETATATITDYFNLLGAVAGFQSFAVIGSANLTYYAATDASGNWEVGLGSYSSSPVRLYRTTVYASSNAGSPVTFSGTINVFVTYPSSKSVNLDDANIAQIPAINVTSSISYNPKSITTNTSIPSGLNGSSAGPLSITATVTVPTGSRWTVV